MKPLLVTVAYHPGDLEIAKKLVQWMVELGSNKPHSILFAADSEIPQTTMREIMDLARPVFNSVKTMIITVPKPTDTQKVWPANHVFLAVARQVKELYKLPFLFLEPDAIPIYPGWADDIAEEYEECPARFMGSIVKQVGQPGLPPEYLNGVAVYPNDAIEVFEKIASVKDSSQAFDVGSASVVVPRAQNTPLIQHFWGEKDIPPIFVETIASGAPKNHVTRGFIKPTTAIFHRSKDGNLIELLRASRTREFQPISNAPSELLDGALKKSEELFVEPKSAPVVVDMLSPTATQSEKRGVFSGKKKETVNP